MRKEIGKKIGAIVAVVGMLMGNMLLLGQEVYAVYEALEEQGRSTNVGQVEYDVYYKEGEKEVHSKKIEIGKQETMYVRIRVREGYMTEGQIALKERNYKIAGEVEEGGIVKKVKKEEGILELNDIEKEQEVVIEIPVEYEKGERVEVEGIDKESKIELKGKYVDSKGKSKEVEGERRVGTTWEKEGEGEIRQEIKKYRETEEGMMLEIGVRSGIKDSSVAVKSQEVVIKVAEIEGKRAEEVKVIGKSLRGSKKEERGESFGEENYSYNKETGEVRIKVENTEDGEGKVAWGEGLDEYRIICRYIGLEAKERQIKVEGKVEIETITGQKVEKEETLEGMISKVGQRISGEIEGSSKVSKGYLYANNGINRLRYESKVGIELSQEGRGEVRIGEEKIVKGEGEKEEKIAAGENIGIERIEISKANVDKMLGEEGSIRIYNEKEEVIGEITRKSEGNAEGKIVIEGREAKELRVEIEEGKVGYLYLDMTKGVKAETSYSREEQEEMKAIEGRVEIGEEEKIQRVELEETRSKAQIEVSQKNLSSVIKNEKIEIKGILETDSQDDELYKNPVIQIVLPKEVEKLEINSIKLLYSEELKIVNYEEKQGEGGEKILEIRLEGEERKYHTAEKGASIVVNVNMEIEKTATSGRRKIEMRYTNERGKAEGKVEEEIEIVAPSGMITIQKLKGHQGEEEIVAIGGQEKEGKIEIQAEKKEAEVGIEIINNNKEAVENVKIIGRIPSEGIEGSTFSTKLKEGIKGAKVYYSEKIEATEEREKEENGWTEEVSENSRSYLIEVGRMEAKEEKEYSYKVEIPEGLNHNETSRGEYEVSYDNGLNGGSRKEEAKGGRVGITTGQGPVLEVELSSNVGETAAITQPITYTVHMKNTGKTAATNVKINCKIPEGLVYAELSDDPYSPDSYIPNPEIKEIKIDVGTIEVGQSITKTFVLLPTKETKVSVEVSITSDNIEKPVETNTVQINIEKSSFKITTGADKETQLVVGENIVYYAIVENITDQPINKVKITTKVDDWLKYVKATMVDDIKGNVTEGISYNEKDKTVTWEVGTLEPGKAVQTSLEATIVKEGNGLIKSPFKVTGENVPDQDGQDITNDSKKVDLETKISCNIEDKYIKEGTVLEYIVEITNKEEIAIEALEILANLPDGLRYAGSKYEISGQVHDVAIFDENTAKVTYTLPGKSTMKVTFLAVADDIGELEKKEITTKLSLQSEKTGTIDLGNFTHIIEKDDSSNPNEDPTKGYRISGVAWLDENKNGAREDEEELLAGIEVKAINTNINKMIVGSDNQVQKVYTGDKGEYELTGLEKGKYVVVFEYDQGKYSLTEYQKEGVASNRNNDVILGSIVEKGEERKTGLTDNIEIVDKSKGNIDIGLIVADQFDLRLDKYVRKITVQDKKGTRSYEYGESKLGKVELDRKTIEGTNIIIEYVMKVTNEGNVGGYVKKIADYIPKELTFQSELNPEWYESKGEIITSSLGNEEILPGETKEVRLVLTKQMTEEGIGNISNKAEIKESYNEAGIEDRDSVAGNKVDGEDDMSKADVIIGIKTGETVAYIGITTILIIVIGIGAYLVNKKVLSI